MTNHIDVEAGDGNPFGSKTTTASRLGATAPPPTGSHAPVTVPSPSAAAASGLAANLERLQRQAYALQAVADQFATASSMLVEATGSDRTQSVAVLVGTDKLPTSLRVAADWRRRISPEQFGSAVTEAALAAAARQTAEALQRVQQSPRSARADLAPGLPPLGGHSITSAPRSPRALVAEMLKAVDAVASYRPPAPARGVGQSANGRFSVSLFADGSVSCRTDPKWTTDASSATLANAFGEALHDARLALARAQSASATQQGNPASTLTNLINDAIALLQDPQRLTDL